VAQPQAVLIVGSRTLLSDGSFLGEVGEDLSSEQRRWGRLGRVKEICKWVPRNQANFLMESVMGGVEVSAVAAVASAQEPALCSAVLSSTLLGK
jgi:hypothetical protein